MSGTVKNFYTDDSTSRVNWPVNKPVIAIIFTILLLCGFVLGWYVNIASDAYKKARKLSFENFNSIHNVDNNVLLHIHTMNEEKIDSLFDVIDALLSTRREGNTTKYVEVVASGGALAMFREGSPYTKRIQSVAEKHKNIAFLVGGLSKINMSLKEHQEIRFIPAAENIASAVDQIVKRMAEGWIYVRE